GAARPAGRPVRFRSRKRSARAGGRLVRTGASCAGSSPRTAPSASRNGRAWGCLRYGRPLPAWLDPTRWRRARGALTGAIQAPTLSLLYSCFPARAQRPRSAAALPAFSEHDPLDAQGRHHLARDFLDRHVGGAEHGDAFGAEQFFGRGHLALAGVQACVARIGPSLLADLLQADRIDGQPEQARTVRAQPWRQAIVFEVFVGKRVIGRGHAVVERQVDAGRRLARTR